MLVIFPLIPSWLWGGSRVSYLPRCVNYYCCSPYKWISLCLRYATQRPWLWTTFSDTRLKMGLFTFFYLGDIDLWLWLLKPSEMWWSLMCGGIGLPVQCADRQPDRHTYSGDIWPTRTCVPYVLSAMVWRHLLHHQFFIRMKNTCVFSEPPKQKIIRVPWIVQKT